MTAWILVIAYHAGGSYDTLETCLSKGQEMQRDKVASGFTASSVCLETGEKQ